MSKETKLSTFLGRAKIALEKSFSEPTWVYGKIISFNNPNEDSHVELLIEDVSPDKDTPAKSSARIWKHNKLDVLSNLNSICGAESPINKCMWFHVEATVTPRYGFQLVVRSISITPENI